MQDYDICKKQFFIKKLPKLKITIVSLHHLSYNSLKFMLQYIIWDVSPEIFRFGYIAVRWYGLLFALSFLFGYSIMSRIFKWEGKPEKDLDRLFLYMIISTVIGARLGHVLFYQPEVYFKNPIDILKIWEGGLASHGAAVTIIIAIYLYARGRKGQSFWWVVDRLVIAIALGGALIRTGNLMNSEIIGKPANVPFALAFTHSLDEALAGEKDFSHAVKTARTASDTTVGKVVYKPISLKLYFDRKANIDEVKLFVDQQLPNTLNGGVEVSKHFSTLGKPLLSKVSEAGKYHVIEVQAYTIPRHAGQFYEAISCFILFGLLFWLYTLFKERMPEGLLFGIFLIVCFSLRFLFEFLKENQVDRESGMTFNIGQLLSIPAVLIGLISLFLAFTRKKKA